jgi:RHH-type proline utilization regulon transcriptional repressor/proline dehydrogenase/delta 1-pyrroline-5-carboxylate dehydrogenase
MRSMPQRDCAGLGGDIHRPRWPAPWVQAVRDNPPPFWAMESLLKEYPISSAEGLALMRLAEALLRVPDAETAIALTADQLGRADFEGRRRQGAGSACRARRSPCKNFLPGTLPGSGARPAEPGLMGQAGRAHRGGRHAARRAAAGPPVRAGPDHGRGMAEAKARAQRKMPNLRYSYDMLGEGARTDADALRTWRATRMLFQR